MSNNCKHIVIKTLVLVCSFMHIVATGAYPTKPGPGNSLFFDGVDDYVGVNAGITLNATNISVEAWVKFPDFDDSDLISKYNDLSGTFADDAFQLVVKSGLLYFEVTDGVSNAVKSSISTSKLKVNTWYHLAGVYNGTKVTLYVNGAPMTSANLGASLGTGGTELLIGAGRKNGALDDYFKGEIDEVRIWNTTLTIANIRSFMCSKNITSHPKYTNLKAYYRFDDGSGTVLGDLSPSGLNGVLKPNMGNANWLNSGAAIGDTSIYNIASATGVTLTIANFGKISSVNTSGIVDSLHIYYVADEPNTTTAPAGFDSLVVPGYFGFFIGGINAKTYDAIYDYTSNAKIVGHPNEDSVKLVGRDNASILSLNTPGTPTTELTDFSAKTITVKTISSRFEAISAFKTKSMCDTSIVAGTWTWKGSIDSDWFNCGNWDQGSLPSKQCKVVIPGVSSVVATRQPKIKAKVAYCKSITIDTSDNAQLTVDVSTGGQLEISD